MFVLLLILALFSASEARELNNLPNYYVPILEDLEKDFNLESSGEFFFEFTSGDFEQESDEDEEDFFGCESELEFSVETFVVNLINRTEVRVFILFVFAFCLMTFRNFWLPLITVVHSLPRKSSGTTACKHCKQMLPI